MTPRPSQPSSKPAWAESSDAVAALIASTRRVKRKLNLLEIADKLRTAQKVLGSLGAVASAVGVSDEMLRQFARVDKLIPEVKQLLAKSQITAVDVADRISRLPPKDQFPVAQAVAAGALNSADVRAIVSLRKTDARIPIAQAIARVSISRNIREYIVEFVVPDRLMETGWLENQFSSIIGAQNIRSLKVRKKVGRIIITEKGKRILEAAARRAGLTKRELVKQILTRR
jgi:hypothetical protein